MPNTFRLSIFAGFLLIPVYLNAAQQILIINTTGEAPLNTPEYTGFMDMVAAEAFKRAGLQLKTVQLPAERGLISANSGVVDGEMSRIASISESYSNLVRIPEKIMDWEFVAFSKQKMDLELGWEALGAYSVGYITGWKILEKNVPKEAKAIKVKAPSQLFSMLTHGRVDSILYERWGGLLLIKNKRLKYIKIQTPPLAVREMFMFLHKKHRDLVPKVTEALKQMKDDGSYDKIFNEILSPLIESHAK